MPADPAAAISSAARSAKESRPVAPLADLLASPAVGDHRRNLVRGVLAALAMATIFTLFWVQWSFSRGRLSQDVTVDDSSYMFEAGRHLSVLYNQGVAAYLANLCKDAPHAPFTDLGAELAFSVFGLHDWVPYVCVNGPIIFLLLLAVAYVGRAVSLRARTAMMFFALAIPFTVVGVHEYRPDFPGALFTALGIYLVIEAALYHTAPRRERQWIVGGLFFGVALVTKSVFFVHTLTMEALSIAGACVFLWWTAEAAAPWQRVLPRFAGVAARVALPSLVVAAPYYLVNFRETFGYFYDFALGANSHVSELKGGLAGSAYFYTFGYAGQLMLGRSFFVGLALYALCLGWVVRMKDRRELFFQGFLLLCAAVSLGSIIVNHRENHYFGVPSDMLLLFMLLRAVAAAWRGLCVTYARAAWGLALLGALGVVNLSLLNADMLWPYTAPPLNYIVGRNHSINQRIIDDIGREFGPRAAVVGPPPVTFVTRGGFITAPTMRWLALKAGLRLDFSDVWTDNNPELFRKGLRDATFVVAPEDNATGVYNQNGPYELRFEVERMMAAMPGLRLLHRYPDSPGGQAYRLFVNDDKMLEQYSDFGDFQVLEGFMPWEGPYPAAKLGRVRWSTGPRSRFALWADTPGDAVLKFNVRADLPVRATLRLRGTPVLAIDASHPAGFQGYAVPVKLQTGANEFVIDYEGKVPTEPDGYQRAFLFRQLKAVASDGKAAPDTVATPEPPGAKSAP